MIDYTIQSCDICGDTFKIHHVCAGPRPKCECGCGMSVDGKQNGVWSRWVSGHQKRRSKKEEG
jgi:hypothetical protein